MSTAMTDAGLPQRATGPVDQGGRMEAMSRPLIRFVPVLQGVLTAVGILAVLAMVFAGPPDLPLPIQLLLLAIPLLFTVAAGMSTVWTIRQTSKGRVLAILVDYLAFLVALLTLMHVMGVFVGVDDLADTFGAALPWIGLAIVAFVLGYVLDALAEQGAAHRAIKAIRWILLAIAAGGFLIAIEAPRGVIGLVTGLLEPGRLGLAVVTFALLAFLMALWGPVGRARYGATVREGDILFGLLLISPNFLGFVAFFAGPLLFSLYVSLTQWDAFSSPVFTGLQNYFDIIALQFLSLSDPSVALAPGLQQGYTEIARFGSFVVAARDKLFWISLRNIIVFSLIAIPLAVGPALLLASLLNSRVRGIRFFRAAYFIPTVAGVVGVAIIWKQLLDQTVGWVNYVITLTVEFLNSTFGLAIVDPKVGWLSDPATALPIIAVVFAWTVVGFNSILFLAGLQGVPGDLYEAAMIDGANRWRRFLNITLPSVAPTTFFVVATTSILAFQLFTEPYVLTSPDPGGPNNATLTPVMYLYTSGFRNFEFGYASAVAWVLFALIFVFTIIQYRRQRADVVG